MALKHNVDVVFVKDRGQLGAEDHAVRIRVVKAGAVDILMDGDDAEGRIRVGSNSLLDRLLMLGHIVVVGVEHDEQAGTVGVVVIAARLGLAVAGLVRVVEVVLVVRVERIMVADRGRNR